MPQANDIATNAANTEAIRWYETHIAVLEQELAPWQNREIPAFKQQWVSDRANLLSTYRSELEALAEPQRSPRLQAESLMAAGRLDDARKL